MLKLIQSSKFNLAKSEIRNPKSEASPKSQRPNGFVRDISDFGHLIVPSDFGFRASDFSPLGGRSWRCSCLAAAVAAENPGRGELAQLVADHVFLHEYLQVFIAVVNLKSMAHEFRNNGA